MAKTQRVKLGDIFAIAIDEREFVVGILAAKVRSMLYVGVFDKVFPTDADSTPNRIDGENIALAALTFDALIHHGTWPILGNRKDLVHLLPKPTYAVKIKGQIHVESLDRKLSRVATNEERNILRFREIVAPIIFDDAVKAKYADKSWEDEYNEFLPDYYYLSANIHI